MEGFKSIVEHYFHNYTVVLSIITETDLTVAMVIKLIKHPLLSDLLACIVVPRNVNVFIAY